MTRKQLLALSATIVGSGAVILDGSVVNLALPHIARDLHAGFADLQWIVDGYLLSLSALILLGGSLGDIFGQRRVYCAGLLGFGVASLLCGLAPTAAILIAVRILQGVFGALLVPGALAILNTSFPPAQRAEAIGRWTAFSSMVMAVGPLLGGVLVDAGSWRLIFLINLPLVLATLVLAKLGVDEQPPEKSRRLDLGGAALAMAGLGGMTYGLIQGPVSHWAPREILILAAGGLLLLCFGWFERRQPDPMLKLDLFRSRNFLAANLTTFALYGGLGGFFFALIIHLQTAAHYSSLAAGASLIPVTVVLFLVSPLAGRWAGLHGPRLFMTAGPLLAAGGIAWLAFIGPAAPYLRAVLPGVTLFALGLSLTVAPLTTTVMSAVHESESGIASGVNNAISRVAGLIVIALLGLFGAAGAYRFAAILCAALAALAGILSCLLVEDPRLKRA